MANNRLVTHAVTQIPFHKVSYGVELSGHSTRAEGASDTATSRASGSISVWLGRVNEVSELKLGAWPVNTEQLSVREGERL